MTISLVSKRALAPHVNVNEDDGRFDKVLHSLAVTASSMIEEYLGRTLDAENRTEYLRSYAYGNPHAQFLTRSSGDVQTLWLEKYPISKTIPIQIIHSWNRDWSTATPLVEGIDYEVLHDKGVVRVFEVDKPFWDSPAGFRVTYRGGYEPTPTGWGSLDVPVALATACAIQTAFMFSSYTRGSMGLDTAGSDDPKSSKATKISDREALIAEVRGALKAFVRKAGSLGKMR